MGFFDNRKISKLRDKYISAAKNGNVSKALEYLDALFDLGYNRAGELLARGYYHGRFFCFDSSPYKNVLTVTPDFAKSRLYFERLLSLYGNKVKATWDQLETKENYYIGWYKAHVAMTYLDTDNKKYLDIMLDAALKNQHPIALAKCALAYETDYEKFGLEQDLSRAVALFITSHKSYSTHRYIDDYFTELGVPADVVLEKIESYQDQFAMAKSYHKEYMQRITQRYLQGQKKLLELEHDRVSFLNELDHKIDWYDKATGERIPDINKVLKDMEDTLEQMNKEV